MTTDPGRYLDAAMTAADLARDLIRTRRPATFTEKADRDLVSDVDVAVERAVREHLHQATPGVGFLGEEEGGPDAGTTGWLWTLDPIDGTSNYAHGIPLCAASLALLRDGRPVLGVIDAPFMAERFHAAEGTGAWSGDLRLAVRDTAALREAIVAIGDYATGPGAARKNETQLAATVSLTPRVHRIRMLGTAALDLAWVAAGRLDASITFANNPWDMAAGIICAREAGATVTATDGSQHTLASAGVIAAAPALIGQLLPLVQTASTAVPPDPGATQTDRAGATSLDSILRSTRYLIFDFDGPIRDPATGQPAGYIAETLAACRDSGRTAVIAATASGDAAAYLVRHGLDQLARQLYSAKPGEHGQDAGREKALNGLIGDLGASPAECALVTTEPAAIQDVRHAGIAIIGYATTPDLEQRLADAGADALLPSLADLTLKLRARPLPN
ncbi:MAG: inositol monophosphatase family protein [Streptosporangiaceae bacterium]